MVKKYKNVLVIIVLSLTIVVASVQLVKFVQLSKAIEEAVRNLTLAENLFKDLTKDIVATEASLADCYIKIETEEKNFKENLSAISELGVKIDTAKEEMDVLSVTVSELDEEITALEEKSLELQSKIKGLK